MIDNRTYYEILQVEPTASFQEIEVAYLRLSSYHQPSVNVRQDARQRLREFREAFDVLHKVELRRAYDARLRRRASLALQSEFASRALPEPVHPPVLLDPTASETLDAPMPAARARAAKPLAWLAYCRQDSERFYLKLDRSVVDAYAILSDFKLRVPAGAREYDSSSQEWRVELHYGDVLRTIFANFDAALDASKEPPLAKANPLAPLTDGTKAPPLPPAKPYPPARPQSRPIQSRIVWAPILILVLGVGLLYNIYLLAQGGASAAPTPTNTPLPIQVIPTPGRRPTITPTPLILSVLPRYGQVHFRAGPGVDYPSLGYLLDSELYTVLGRTSDSTWVQVDAGGELGWAAAWTMQITDTLFLLSIVSTPTPPTPDASAPVPETEGATSP